MFHDAKCERPIGRQLFECLLAKRANKKGFTFTWSSWKALSSYFSRTGDDSQGVNRGIRNTDPKGLDPKIQKSELGGPKFQLSTQETSPCRHFCWKLVMELFWGSMRGHRWTALVLLLTFWRKYRSGSPQNPRCSLGCEKENPEAIRNAQICLSDVYHSPAVDLQISRKISEIHQQITRTENQFSRHVHNENIAWSSENCSFWIKYTLTVSFHVQRICSLHSSSGTSSNVQTTSILQESENLAENISHEKFSICDVISIRLFLLLAGSWEGELKDSIIHSSD